MNGQEAENVFQQVVCESHIDWLFCVELNASKEFRKWVAPQVFKSLNEFEHIRAWRSVSNASGESDILWLVETTNEGRAIAMIENKIDAVAQPDQYLRYTQRGESYIKQGNCQRFSVALLSPEKYQSSDSTSYPIKITYEAVVKWFSARSDERSQYLSSIFQKAINKLGTIAPVDGYCSNFQELIWQIAQAEFPYLNVPDPNLVSGSQYWVYMKQLGYTIILKMKKKNNIFNNCMVDLELTGRGSEIDLLKQRYESNLAGTGIMIEPTGKSASFRLAVPSLSPLDFDENRVREALRAAAKLKSWWESISAT